MFNEMQETVQPQTTNRSRPPQIQSPLSQNTGVPQPRATTSQSATSQNMMPAQGNSIAQPLQASQLPVARPATSPPTPPVASQVSQVNMPSSSTASTSPAVPPPVSATLPTSSQPTQSSQSQIVDLLRLLPNAATRQQVEEQKHLLMHLIQQMQQMEGLPTSLFAMKKRLEQTTTSSELETILKELNLNQDHPTDSDQQEQIKSQLDLIIHALIDLKKHQNPSQIQKLIDWKLPDWKWKDKAKRWAKSIIKPLGGTLKLAFIVAVILGIIRMGELNQNLNLLNSTLQNSTRRTAK